MSAAQNTPRVNLQTCKLSPELDAAVQDALHEWQRNAKVRRLWERDASLWTGSDEAKWLGWLDLARDFQSQREKLDAFAKEVRRMKWSHVLLLGMGGSSLCPEVLAQTFGKQPEFPELHVLDSTDPSQVKAFEAKVDLAQTLFVVASKSGSTLEPNIFKQYFFERVQQAVGPNEAGKRFVAITDPGSKMQQVAEQDGFRHIFFGVPSVGGRYSALSNFGLVPAAAMGLNVQRFMDGASEMARACSASTKADENPGVVLGAILGVLAKCGRDKVTLITSRGIYDLGAWLEQLLAESTGKEGKGLIPVDRERLGRSNMYGSDRVFVYLRLATSPDAAQEQAVYALEKSGQPLVHISVNDVYSLGQEFFRWEIATAVAGSILGVNAFNQPDVEASKMETRKLTSAYEASGALPAETPVVDEGGLRLFTDERNANALKLSAAADSSLKGFLRAHLNRISPGDYFAILAYIEMDDAHEALLQDMRHDVRDARHVATCLGFGPRFLHSTGQAYKGGPNSGVFLQVTCEDAVDLPVPGQKFTFGVVKAAQARGDFEVLAERHRRVLRVHLGKDAKAGLAALRAAVRQALTS